MFTVSQLALYPLKSARGYRVDPMELVERGPRFDRSWMVVDQNGHFLSQRQHPSMCLIKTEVNHGALTLSAINTSPCQIELDSNQPRKVRVWRDTVIANDCGESAAKWLSEYLGVSCRLVFLPEHSQRLVNPDYAKKQQTVSFADGYPLLITSEASLEDFNTKLKAPISMTHFRPNIVVRGCTPYAEDQWNKIRIGEVYMSVVKPCTRCIIPAIDPNTGIKNMEITDALNKYRRRDGATFFGQNALHDQIGTISVGDTVELIK